MKSKIFTIRFNQLQFAQLALEAQNSNINLGELIRYKMGLIKKSEMDRALFLLHKTSNNINQIAKGINIANLAKKVNDFTYTQTLARLAIVQTEFKNIYNLVQEIRDAN